MNQPVASSIIECHKGLGHCSLDNRKLRRHLKKQPNQPSRVCVFLLVVVCLENMGMHIFTNWFSIPSVFQPSNNLSQCQWNIFLPEHLRTICQ